MERLGAGAMGEVWKALDIKFQSRHVAIKLLKEDDFHHEDARNRGRLLELVRVATESGGMSEAQAVDALHELLKNVGSTDSLRLRVASHVDARGRVPGDAVLQLFQELISNPSFSENAKARARMRRLFHDEANSVANLRHDNIVSISDYGEHDGQPFLAMDYIEGQTLATVIQRGRGVPLTRQLEWMEDLCAGLAYAHARHLVHRDIKPANLIVEAGTDSLKILDFGVVRRLQNVSETTVGVTVGTLCYMSPEQLVGSASLDHRSDIFSVGAVLYELLTGKKAFPPGESILDLLNRIQFEDPRPARDYAPALPPALDGILTQALAKNRDARYQDLLAMRRDLARVRKRLEIESELNERTHTLPRPDPHPDRPALESAGSAPSFAAPAPADGSASELNAPVEERPASDPRSIAHDSALRTQRLVSDAIAALDRHDFSGARAAVNEALTLDSSHELARTLRVRIEVEWARARALEDARRTQQEEAAAEARERERAAAEALAAQAREEARVAQQRREAEAREAAAREAEARAAAAREAEARAAAAREAEAREAAAREAAAREAAREAAAREAAREAAAREEAARKAKAREAAAREAEARNAAAREAAAREEAARRAEARAVAAREAAAQEALARATQQEAAADLTIEARAEPFAERPSETDPVDQSRAYAKTRRFDPHDLRQRADDEHEPRPSPDTRSRRWRLAMMASAAVLVAAVAVAVYVLSRPQVHTPPVSEGNTTPPVPLAVTIDIQPWARVRILDATGAEVLPAPLATPLSVSLPPGRYTLDCENGGLTARASFSLEVGSDRPTLVRLVMPGFDADAALRNLLGPPR